MTIISQLKCELQQATGHGTETITVMSPVAGKAIDDDWVITKTITNFVVIINLPPKLERYRIVLKIDSSDLRHQQFVLSVTTTQDGDETMDIESVFVEKDSSTAHHRRHLNVLAVTARKNAAKGRFLYKSADLHWVFTVSEERFELWDITLLYFPKTSTWIPLDANAYGNTANVTDFSVTRVFDDAPAAFSVQTPE